MFIRWLRRLIRWLRRVFRWQVFPPPQPGPFTISDQKEVNVLRYTINMPPAPAISDLGSREVTIDLDGVQSGMSLKPTDTTFQFDCDRGVNVTLTMVDVDTSGNKSAPGPALTFLSVDNIPPPVPGGMSVALVEQIDTTTAGPSRK